MQEIEVINRVSELMTSRFSLTAVDGTGCRKTRPCCRMLVGCNLGMRMNTTWAQGAWRPCYLSATGCDVIAVRHAHECHWLSGIITINLACLSNDY